MLVEDTIKIQADVFGHHGRIVEGTVTVGDSFVAKVDVERRAKTVRNHSATHLMHKALREVLGAHVQQKGSLVNADRTRFDFAHTGPLTPEQIRKVEEIVNAEVLANAQASAVTMGIDDAQKSGAMMLFGEKYGDEVRVLTIGSSKELCGGTHVQRTGDIGVFKVVAESGVAAGIRRIEAITGDNALAYLQSLEDTVDSVAGTLKAQPDEVPARLAAVLDHVKQLEKEIEKLKGKLASAQGDELVLQAVDVKGLKVLAAKLDGADAKTLRDTMDKLKDKLKTAAIVLAAVDGDKVQIAAGVTADSIGRIKAGELVNFVAQQVGGKGGGKPDMAMAGGTDAVQAGRRARQRAGLGAGTRLTRHRPRGLASRHANAAHPSESAALPSCAVRPQTGPMTSTFAASNALARARLRAGAGARMRALAVVASDGDVQVVVAPHRSPAQGPPALH